MMGALGQVLWEWQQRDLCFFSLENRQPWRDPIAASTCREATEEMPPASVRRCNGRRRRDSGHKFPI